MRVGRIIGFSFTVLFILLGLIFLLATGSAQNTNKSQDLTLGLILLAIGIGLLVLVLKFLPATKVEHTVIQRVELTGKIDLNQIKCRNCGGSLAAESLKIAGDGTVVASCPYCGTTFHVTEEPKW
ncbi:MAG: hypothetical protein GX444_21285 [Myxococcales bacterium]|nr:hypothetical protein [Myxococcales bacterium]